MTHPITIDMLEEGHLLLLGTTGAGKTYQQRGFLERLRRADRRVGAVDKLGNHWGLTLSADGERPGLDFVIFGGKRAHVPMTPSDGERIGRLFVERNIPAIFDVSQWKSDEQLEWMEGFADAVFLHNTGALHLGLDEAQSWVPQGGGGDAFNSVRRLAEQGRGNGIFLMLACQRWSRLDSSVRGMADNLIVAMRQTSPIDRKAIADLVALDRTQHAAIMEQLPLLKNGEGYVWEPREARAVRYQFPPNTTFDSSRTPRHGDTPPAPIAVSSELVEELRRAMAPAPEDHPDDTIPNDPLEAFEKGSAVGVMLAERDRAIAGLQNRVHDVGHVALEISTAVSGLAYHVERVLAEIAGAFEAYFPDVTLPAGLLNAQSALRGDGTTRRVDDLGSVQDARKMSTDGQQSLSAPAAPARRPKAEGAAHVPEQPRAAPTPSPEREYRSLAVLAAIYPAGLTETAWAGRAGRARKGGAWQQQRRRYAKAGLVEQRDGRWHATSAGVVAAGADIPTLPRPGRELVEWWAGRLRRGGGGRLLQILFDKRGLTRDALAAEARMTASGGAFNAYVQELKRNELIDERGKRLFVSPALTGE